MSLYEAEMKRVTWQPQLFESPPASYRPAPLWVWNDKMKREQIREQLESMKEQGFGGAFVHPRPGLVTEYLSEEWFELWGFALNAAKELNLKLYIYDENSYPSGFAGGHVSSQLPDCLATAAVARTYKQEELSKLPANNSPMLNRPGHPIRAYAIENAGIGIVRLIHDVSELSMEQWPRYGERFLVIELSTAETHSWHGGFAYTDLMRPEVTELFLQTTYEPYYKRFGRDFGGTIPAVFTDEPEISTGTMFNHSSGIRPFSFWFASQFEQRNGYDLKDCLPALFMDVEGLPNNLDAQKVRYDYYTTIHELWVENSVRPISDWCGQRGIAYTGHYLEHNWPYPWGGTSPSVMSLYEYMHWPAIDMLMTYLLKRSESRGVEPHMMTTIREVHSAANQFGRERVLCETYGAGGWESTFEDYKRIGDWLYVHGINFMNQHLTFATISGARKRDHPQSFDWRQPWWKQYRALNDYYSRLSYALSSGATRNRILMMNPTVAAYLLSPEKGSAELETKHEQMVNQDMLLFQALCDLQWDYDFGDEYIIQRHGSVEAGRFIVGNCSYRAVIVPSSMNHLKESSYELLLRYLDSGGVVYSLCEEITRIDGKPDGRLNSLQQHDRWIRAGGISELDAALRTELKPWVSIRPFDGKLPQGIAHLRRELDDGSTLYFIVNSSDTAVDAEVSLEGSHVQQFDPWGGSVDSTDFNTDGEHIRCSISLPASGSVLLQVNGTAENPIDSRLSGASGQTAANSNGVASAMLQSVQAEEDNYLLLDFVDLKIDSKAYQNIHTLQANRKIYEHRGFAMNPWDNGVQYKNRLMDRNRFYGAESGFALTYRFFIREDADLPKVNLALERAEDYRMLVNDQMPTASWVPSKLDSYISEIDVTSCLKPGENTVTLVADRFHVLLEVESIYLKGAFAVHAREGSWLLDSPLPLQLGPWTRQGYSFYPGAIDYIYHVELPQGANGLRVRLSNWLGTVASVRVDCGEERLIGVGKGDEISVQQILQPGTHTVSIRICGSFKNLLGPHHDPAKPRGMAWPGNWKTAPIYGPPSAEQYDFMEYGLLEEAEFFLTNAENI